MNGVGWGVESWGREEEGGRCVIFGWVVFEGFLVGCLCSIVLVSGVCWLSVGVVVCLGWC